MSSAPSASPGWAERLLSDTLAVTVAQGEGTGLPGGLALATVGPEVPDVTAAHNEHAGHLLKTKYLCLPPHSYVEIPSLGMTVFASELFGATRLGGHPAWDRCPFRSNFRVLLHPKHHAWLE